MAKKTVWNGATGALRETLSGVMRVMAKSGGDKESVVFLDPKGSLVAAPTKSVRLLVPCVDGLDGMEFSFSIAVMTQILGALVACPQACITHTIKASGDSLYFDGTNGGQRTTAVLPVGVAGDSSAVSSSEIERLVDGAISSEKKIVDSAKLLGSILKMQEITKLRNPKSSEIDATEDYLLMRVAEDGKTLRVFGGGISVVEASSHILNSELHKFGGMYQMIPIAAVAIIDTVMASGIMDGAPVLSWYEGTMVVSWNNLKLVFVLLSAIPSELLHLTSVIDQATALLVEYNETVASGGIAPELYSLPSGDEITNYLKVASSLAGGDRSIVTIYHSGGGIAFRTSGANGAIDKFIKHSSNAPHDRCIVYSLPISTIKSLISGGFTHFVSTEDDDMETPDERFSLVSALIWCTETTEDMCYNVPNIVVAADYPQGSHLAQLISENVEETVAPVAPVENTLPVDTEYLQEQAADDIPPKFTDDDIPF